MLQNNQVVLKSYIDKGFWKKLIQYAKLAGKDVIEKALWLYYAAQNPNTPTWAKTVIYGSLGYFILPIDAIPDITPVIGFVDDVGVLASAILTVSLYIDDDVKSKATIKLANWFDESL